MKPSFHKTLSLSVLPLTTALAIATPSLAQTNPLNQALENRLAAQSEICLHKAMTAVRPNYAPKMPYYDPNGATAVEDGTTDSTLRISTEIDHETGAVSATVSSERNKFDYSNGEARLVETTGVEYSNDNVFDPNGGVLSSAYQISGSNLTMLNVESNDNEASMALDRFQACMTAPYTKDGVDYSNHRPGDMQNAYTAALAQNTL